MTEPEQLSMQLSAPTKTINPVGDFQNTPLKNPNNKWMVRSALQKAVRRRDLPTALNTGGRLFATDEAYFWKSMAIIAIEDVAFGDTEGSIIALRSTRKTYLKSRAITLGVTNADMAIHLITRLTLAIKTRICCEIALPNDLTPMVSSEEKETTLALLKEISTDTELTFDFTLKDLREDLTLAYRLTVLANGKAYDLKEERPLKNLKALNHLLDLCRPEDLELLNECLSTPIDSMMAAAIPASMLLRQIGDDITIQKDPEFAPPVEVFKGLPDYALDMHTRAGKMAINTLYHQHKEEYPVLQDMGKPSSGLGAVLFVLEGGVCDQRMRNPLLDGAKLWQDETFIKSYGQYSGDVEALYTVIKQPHVQKKLANLRAWAFHKES
ncbi:MAG: hypothetical protein OEX12_11260 [Gammaproteobacteria bacterium]|nr:hypothetical protein [Gammaproteobacteria bacterium]